MTIDTQDDDEFGPDEPDPAPDMAKIRQLVGRPDYGVAFCLAPWPDGGWQAGVQLTDREWVEERCDLGRHMLRNSPGVGPRAYDHVAPETA